MSYVTNKATCAAMLEALELQLRALHARNAARIMTMHNVRTQYVRSAAATLPSAAAATERAPFADTMAAGGATSHFRAKHKAAGSAPQSRDLDQVHATAHLGALVGLQLRSQPDDSDAGAAAHKEGRSPTAESMRHPSTQSGSNAQKHVVGQPEIPGSQRQPSSRRSDSGDPDFEAFIRRVRKQGSGVHHMHHVSAHQVRAPCHAARNRLSLSCSMRCPCQILRGGRDAVCACCTAVHCPACHLLRRLSCSLQHRCMC